MSALGLSACKDPSKEGENRPEEASRPDRPEAGPFFSISLAQWSIHRMIREEGFDPYGFARLSSEWGFEGLEYVNQLYNAALGAENHSAAAIKKFVDKSTAESSKYGLPNLLIMIDGEGNLAASDPAERQQAVANHRKWVDAAADLGCHSIRVNLSGASDPAEWKKASVEGLKALSDLGAQKNMNILVENHGGLSSDASLLAGVMKEVDMPNCGTLPDFGNFCIRRDDSGSACLEEYDKYRGVRELMPWAKAVSAKSHRFDTEGDEIDIDYRSMLLIVRESGYNGFIGVEYEGMGLTEEAGIRATRDLLLSAAGDLA